ncbi:UbiA family prenyltransferase [Acanthopleuribacter pedis]|uniref:UbiA family prenyltransferase n=1 Tax=Acanthopleuribacter pedis TaxID=442870 RepID=A0A8J7Q1W8_9BACT|nr:UbiA family prenyltransferase [Acanthopleuribacter pedis]MBO1316887.1 UbiA family prenyltransferase [Acanthopleuribacter pedis]
MRTFADVISESHRRRLVAVWMLSRPHQWSKNLLVLVPLLTAHRIAEPGLLPRGLAAFAAFCCCASLGYVVNDWRDIAHDRRHPRKKDRPFAAGLEPMPLVLWLLPSLALGALLVAAPLGLAVGSALAVYTLVSLGYSLVFKRVTGLDILVLALLYTSRLWVGGLATATPVSPWLLTFALGFFASLASAKRVTALTKAAARGESGLPGRPYRVANRRLLIAAGVLSGVFAMLVLVFYVESATVAALYTRPAALWPVFCVVLLWLVRLWWLAVRGRLDWDPVLFALRDPLSYGLLLLGALGVTWAL